MNGAVVPRPIALVSTIGSDGPNVSPFSYFNVVSVDPCVVMFSIGVAVGPRLGLVKDTLQNLREVPEFVVHIVDAPIAEKMNASSAEFARGQDEMSIVGFNTAPSVVVKPPRIIDAPVQFECKVHEIIVLGRAPYHMVLGEVVQMHFRKGIVNERHHVDPSLHQPIARLGGPGLYMRSTDQFVMAPPVPPR